MYYLGKGKELKKEECKEYKTLKNALAAAEKDGELTVWDESGKIMNAGNAENGEKESQAEDLPYEQENAENEENTAPQTGEEKEGEWQQESAIEEVQGLVKATVVCDGALNIRRSPAWGNKNICGRAVRGQSYYVKEINMVDGKKMVRTIDDLYISGQPEHVKIEQM